MKTRTSLSMLLPTMLVLAGGQVQAADDPSEADSQSAATASVADEGTTTSGEVTAKLFVFDYFDGPGRGLTQPVERYNPQKAFGGSRNSGAYLDADVHLEVKDSDRTLVSLERLGFGLHNHRGKLEADSALFGFDAYYTQFRTAGGGIEWLYNANRVAGGTDPTVFFPAGTNTNSGYFAQFNDDSGRTRFDVSRLNYGAAVQVKPAALGDSGAMRVGIDGYRRSGNQLTRYVLGGGDIREAGTNAETPGRVLQRWRGIAQDIDESSNRISVNLSAMPGDAAVISYDVSWDRFDNSARNFVHADVTEFLPPGWQYNTGANANRPLGFAPDSHLLRHGLRLAHSFGGKTAIAAGFGQSRLGQDSYTVPQEQVRFDGTISTQSAFFNIASNVLPRVRLEGFFRYHDRDNDSTFPVAGLIHPVNSEQLGVRINSLESKTYGLIGTFRSNPLNSTFTLGWKHEEKDRDLTFHTTSTTPPVNGISQDMSLYRDRSEYDELSLRIVSRFGKNVTLRLTPSYLRADAVGMVTEPERHLRLKANLSYLAPSGTVFSAYANHSNKRNNDLSFLGTDGNLATQDSERSANALGGSVALNPSEWVSVQVGLSWLKDDFEALYFGSNRRRFEAPNNPVIFFLRDSSKYNIDSYVLSASADWQVKDELSYQFGYILTRSNGHTASGEILSELPTVDGRFDSQMHSAQAGFTYQHSRKLKLTGMYVLDYYNDDAFDQISGGVHSLMFGVGVSF